MNAFRASFLLGGALLATASAAHAATVATGTELEVRLLTEISDKQAAGAPVRAVVIAPVFVGGTLVLAAGAELSGTITAAQPPRDATDTAPAAPASVRAIFDTVRAGGTVPSSQPVRCLVAAVENARETVDDTGLIVGINAAQTIGSRMDQGIAKVSGRNSQLGSLLSGVEGAFVKKVDPSIDFKPGVELRVRLTAPLNLEGSAWQTGPPGTTPPPVAPAQQLLDLVAVEPNRTVAENPPNPSDLTNLLFIGTLDQVQHAFEAAGWFQSARKGGTANLETARAIIENRGYNEAPMSVLFLDGRPPDLTFEKQNDTFSQRHHIRIWQRPETFGGQPVFVAAATHDTSITFSSTSHSFTHGIDPEIDKERAKVVNDLLFTGLVRGLALVARHSLPPDPSNATGDHLITDGKMAVLQF